MRTRNLFFKATIWIIFLLTALRIFQLIIRIYAITIMQKIATGAIGYEKLQSIVSGYNMEEVISYILWGMWLICFLSWFYISYKRAQRYTRQYFSFKPIWALFSYIIPIFNIFAPYKIMHEIWSAENRDMAQEQSGKRLINVWWFLSLGLLVFSRYLNIHFNSAKVLSDVIRSEYYFIVYYAVGIHYLFVLRKLMMLINSEQKNRDQYVEQ